MRTLVSTVLREEKNLLTFHDGQHKVGPTEDAMLNAAQVELQNFRRGYKLNFRYGDKHLQIPATPHATL
jgi:hypothetical protein